MPNGTIYVIIKDKTEKIDQCEYEELSDGSIQTYWNNWLFGCWETSQRYPKGKWFLTRQEAIESLTQEYEKKIIETAKKLEKIKALK